MTEREFVLVATADGCLVTAAPPRVRWEILDEETPQRRPYASEESRMRAEIGAIIARAEINPPVISHSRGSDGGLVTHVDWPDLTEHPDADIARLLTICRLPLDREIADGDGVTRNADLERRVAEQAEADRALWRDERRREVFANWDINNARAAQAAARAARNGAATTAPGREPPRTVTASAGSVRVRSRVRLRGVT